MVKEIALIKRKPGLSREEFSRHYEEVYVPLIWKYSPPIKRYVRNYIINPFVGEEPDFDCITEVWYENMEGFKAFGKVRNSEAGKVIIDNEAKFMDRSKIAAFLVEEKVSK